MVWLTLPDLQRLTKCQLLHCRFMKASLRSVTVFSLDFYVSPISIAESESALNGCVICNDLYYIFC